MILAGLGLAACGGGIDTAPHGRAPSSGEVAACLQRGGVVKIEQEVHDNYEETIGLSDRGDAVYVLRLSTGDEAEQARRLVRKAMRQGRPGAISITAILNGGYSVIGIVGVPGTDGGVPSAEGERLVRECAVHPRTLT